MKKEDLPSFGSTKECPACGRINCFQRMYAQASYQSFEPYMPERMNIICGSCGWRGVERRYEMDWLESEEFYEAMQEYRHTPLENQPAVIAAFERVKQLIREHCEV